MRGVDLQDAAGMRTLRRDLVREDWARDFELKRIFFPRWVYSAWYRGGNARRVAYILFDGINTPTLLASSQSFVSLIHTENTKRHPVLVT